MLQSRRVGSGIERHLLKVFGLRRAHGLRLDHLAIAQQLHAEVFVGEARILDFGDDREAVALIGYFVEVQCPQVNVLSARGIAQAHGYDRETVGAVERRGSLVVEAVAEQHHTAKVAIFVVVLNITE